MFCKYCGTKNIEEAIFCKECGKQLASNKLFQENVIIEHLHPNETMTQLNHEISCPYCHATGSACYPVDKTKVSGSRYGFWNGCCGLVLLGPVGLLCGLCGNHIKLSNETWWICKKCGKEFISKQSALERANISMKTSALYSFILAMSIGYSFRETGTFWIDMILILIIIGLWASIPMAIQEDSGIPMDRLLTNEELREFWVKFSAFCILSILSGLLFGL